jgi:hypothetical protein
MKRLGLRSTRADLVVGHATSPRGGADAIPAP